MRVLTALTLVSSRAYQKRTVSLFSWGRLRRCGSLRRHGILGRLWTS